MTSETSEELHSIAEKVAAETKDHTLVADVDQFLALRKRLGDWFDIKESNPTAALREQWKELAKAVRKVVADLNVEYNRRYEWIEKEGRDAATQVADASTATPAKPDDLSNTVGKITDVGTMFVAYKSLKHLKEEVRPRISKLKRALLFTQVLRWVASFFGLLAKALWFVALSAILLWLHHPFEDVAKKSSAAADQWHVSLPSFVVLLLIVIVCEGLRQRFLDPKFESTWTKWVQSRTRAETNRLLNLAGEARIEVARMNFGSR